MLTNIVEQEKPVSNGGLSEFKNLQVLCKTCNLKKSNEMINGGYYIKARKIQESDIAFAPPHVREIWDWLIKEVNHIDSCKIKRGQTMRSLRDIQEGLR